jgi:hypothetical protein
MPLRRADRALVVRPEGDLRAEAAAVSAMARGSQHGTIANISHLIACSVVPPSSFATYMIGAATTKSRHVIAVVSCLLA